MYIKELQITNFRNYEHQHIVFSDAVNVFIGENAQGKTNALESIQLLAMGKSHRTHKDSDFIRWGASEAVIEAAVVLKNREQRLRMYYKPGAKRVSVNGVSMSKMTDFIGHFQVVLFAPEDLQLVKGGPQGRRRFIDMEMGQTQPHYLYHLGQYARTMQQRNTLLKQKEIDWDYIGVFDEQLAEHAVQILLRRLAFLRQIRELSQQVYEGISEGREKLTMQYVSTVPGVDPDHPPSPEELTEQYRRAMFKKRDRDRQFGYTHVGPHRDDLSFFLDGQPVQSFASQGQQRTIALSMRLAEIDFIFREIGEYPVLLLDDVLSELDDIRQKNLVLSMSEKVQTIITTTSLFQLTDKLQHASRLFHVRSGIIQE